MDKKLIKEYCIGHIDKKIKVLEKGVHQIQQSANADTKSSAGDKHETSRAMAHLEKEQLAKQLHKLVLSKRALLQINVEKTHSKVNVGSYVVTEAGDFFLSLGLGEIKTKSHRFHAVAIHSPIGKNMHEKKVGDVFVLAKKMVKIVAIY